MFTAIMVVGTTAAVFAAIAQVGIRHLTMTEPVPRIVFYFGVIASTVSALPLIWTWVTPSPTTWAALIVTGVSATFGQLALTRAYSHAPVASVGPFIYVGVLFAALIDWAVWQTPPDRWFAIGALLIVSAGAALLRVQGPLEADA
jgi:drug/metabolite transporter (DMT)-like permease